VLLVIKAVHTGNLPKIYANLSSGFEDQFGLVSVPVRGCW